MLFLKENNTGGHSFFKRKSNQKSIGVSTISLDSFVKKNNIKRIDFLKMDCEGAEYRILYGCSKETLKNIQKISMEYHNFDEKNNNVHSLKKFLEHNGFKVIIPSNSVLNLLYAFR